MSSRSILTVRDGQPIPLYYARKDPSTGSYYNSSQITAVAAEVRKLDGTLLASPSLTYVANLKGYAAEWSPGSLLNGISGAIVLLTPTLSGVPAALALPKEYELDLSDVQKRVDEVRARIDRRPDFAPGQFPVDPQRVLAPLAFYTGQSSQLPVVALRNVSTGYYLDFADSTFKGSGWTTKYLALAESERGFYYSSWSPKSLNDAGRIATGDVLAEEYYIDDGSGFSGQGGRMLVIDPSAASSLAYAATTLVADIKGSQNLSISDLAGTSYNAALASLMAAKSQRDSISTSVTSIQNTTRFAATIPTLERPASGSIAYKLRVNLEDTSGNPEDPDSSTITIGATNGAGDNRSGNLSSTTMTRLAQGRYEVAYSVDSAHALEQLLFTFSYAEGAVSFVKDKTETVVDADVLGFTSSDRATLGAIFADTDAMAPLVTANVDAAISSRATPGAAMALTTGERIATAAQVDSQLSSTHGSSSWLTSTLTVPEIVDGVLDAPIASHGSTGSVGATIAAAAAGNVDYDAIRDAVIGADPSGYSAGSVGARITETSDRVDVVLSVVRDDVNANVNAAEASLAADIDAVPAAVLSEDPTTYLDGSVGERIVTASDEAVMNRKHRDNSLVASSGDPGSLVLYDDDGTTPLRTWEVRDENGGPVRPTVGSPAKRGPAT